MRSWLEGATLAVAFSTNACGGLALPIDSSGVDGGATSAASGSTPSDASAIADAGPREGDATASPPPPPDGAPPVCGAAGGADDTCPGGFVCCHAPEPCANLCVPDCRTHRDLACPEGTSCDDATGVCLRVAK